MDLFNSNGLDYLLFGGRSRPMAELDVIGCLVSAEFKLGKEHVVFFTNWLVKSAKEN